MDKEQYEAQLRQLDIDERKARLQYVQPIGASGVSTAAMICGFLPLPLLGVVLGICGLATAKNSDSSGRASIGLIGGIIWFCVAMAFKA